MDENNRNSMKLDIEAVRLSDGEHVAPKETYKSIPEYPDSTSVDEKRRTEGTQNSMMVSSMMQFWAGIATKCWV